MDIKFVLQIIDTLAQNIEAGGYIRLLAQTALQLLDKEHVLTVWACDTCSGINSTGDAVCKFCGDPKKDATKQILATILAYYKGVLLWKSLFIGRILQIIIN